MGDETGVRTVSVNYMYMRSGQETHEENVLSTVATKDRAASMTLSQVAQSKGVQPHAVSVVVNVLERVGYKRPILNTDCDPEFFVTDGCSVERA